MQLPINATPAGLVCLCSHRHTGRQTLRWSKDSSLLLFKPVPPHAECREDLRFASNQWEMARLQYMTDCNAGGCNACLVRAFSLAGSEESCCYAFFACTEGREPWEVACHCSVRKWSHIDGLQRADSANNLISLEPEPALVKWMMIPHPSNLVNIWCQRTQPSLSDFLYDMKWH